MKPGTIALLLLALLLTLFAGWYLFDNKMIFAPDRQAITRTADTQPAPADESSTRQPMPQRYPVAPPENLPDSVASGPAEPPFPAAIEASDDYLKQRLPQLIETPKLLALLNLTNFIQKLVVIIDQLPEKTIPRQHLPITPPKPGFLTVAAGEQQQIDSRNAARYTPYVALTEAIPDAPLIRLYRGLYPFFQQAYRETGDPNGFFNDRLIQVIDHLLETPEPKNPIIVKKHISSYKYADDALEARSAGQKILLRMGVDNARRVKEKLLRLRQALVQRNDW